MKRPYLIRDALGALACAALVYAAPWIIHALAH